MFLLTFKGDKFLPQSNIYHHVFQLKQNRCMFNQKTRCVQFSAAAECATRVSMCASGSNNQMCNSQRLNVQQSENALCAVSSSRRVCNKMFSMCATIKHAHESNNQVCNISSFQHQPSVYKVFSMCATINSQQSTTQCATIVCSFQQAPSVQHCATRVCQPLDPLAARLR